MSEINISDETQAVIDGLIGQQKEAYMELINFMENGGHMFTFEGYAGVGKTYCINKFVNQMIETHGTNICITAPTHKALRVIAKMAGETEHLDFRTIHSLLGLRPVIDNRTGEQQFLKDHQATNAVSEFDLIIVDEASQIDNLIFSYLMSEIDANGVRIIFIGDGKQLPPVNHSSSIPMSADKREVMQIAYTQLTEIVRQKGTNPIIKLSKQIRNGCAEIESDFNADGEGVLVINGSENHNQVLRDLFGSENYKQDQDFCRMVAWRNVSVNAYNRKIRNLIYQEGVNNFVLSKKGSGIAKEQLIAEMVKEFPHFRDGGFKLPYIIVGDVVIVDKPIMDNEMGNTIVYNTNEELIVNSFRIEYRMFYGTRYTCYIADVCEITTNKHNTITICHEESHAELEKEVGKLQKRALDQKDFKKRPKLWKNYYNLKTKFAELKYAPCLTTYKAQGSTYENVIIHYQDIIQNRNTTQMLQHLYVGVTRASKRCFVFK